MKGLFDPILRLLFPPRCVLCQRLLEKGATDICPSCLTAAAVFYHQQWKIPNVKSWHAMWRYNGNVRDSLVRFKFWNKRSYCVAYGRELCRQLGQRPVCLLHKKRHNRKQSTLHGLEQRRQNVRDAYVPVGGVELRGKRVLLVEDIITTGATVSECARVLKAAGAKEVHAVCVATANTYGK